MEFIFGYVLGAIVGIVIYRTWFCRPVGTLRIDRTNPEKDVYRFEIDYNLDDLAFKKRITIRIDNNANLSQE